MKLLVLEDTALTNLDMKFRQSPLAQLIPSLIFFSLTGGAVYWYWFRGMHLITAVLFGGMMFLMGLALFSSFKKALAPTNWLLAIGPDRVLIKFRSYLNAHFPSTDPQVVLLDPSEIAYARIAKQKIKVPGSRNRNRTSFHTFLDLHVPSTDLMPLKDRIKYERILKPQKTGKYTKSKCHHYPVSILNIDTIRIEWPSPIIFIAPGISRALTMLSRQGVKIESPKKEFVDLTEKGRSDLKSSEDKILYLAERGNLIAAAKLAQRTYKLSLAQAKQFVEDILE